MASKKKKALVPWLSALSDGKDCRFIQIGNSLLLEYAEQDGACGPQPWCTQNAQMVQSRRVNSAQEKTSV